MQPEVANGRIAEGLTEAQFLAQPVRDRAKIVGGEDDLAEAGDTVSRAGHEDAVWRLTG
jgi:hypothetical protein